MVKRAILAILFFVLTTGFLPLFHTSIFAVDVCGTCPCSDTNPQISTAIGCIPTDFQGFIGKFLGLGIGIGGGIAFLLILFGGFQILMSAGNPEKLNAGKELVTSAITGLLLIIFSLFILRLIGFNILGIPGFG